MRNSGFKSPWLHSGPVSPRGFFRSRLNDMDQQFLTRLVVSGLSQRGIGKAAGRSQATVKWWLRKYGLRTAPNPWNRAEAFRCRYCGTEDESLAKNAGNGRRSPSVCSPCADRRRVEQMRAVKRRAVEFKGGQCERCGYDRCPAALQFHHTDPASKSPAWESFRSYRWERVLAELSGCELVCANCHAEEHFLSFHDPPPPLTSMAGRHGRKLGRPFASNDGAPGQDRHAPRRIKKGADCPPQIQPTQVPDVKPRGPARRVGR